MRRTGSVVIGALATVTIVVVMWLAPEQLPTIARAAFPLIAAVAIRAIALDLFRVDPALSRPRRARRRRSPEDVPKELVRIEAALSVSSSSTRQAYQRLRPLLRDIAEDRLDVRRGIALDDEPARAHAALGDEAWSLLRPDHPVPKDHSRSGPSSSDVEKIVSTLEAV